LIKKKKRRLKDKNWRRFEVVWYPLDWTVIDKKQAQRTPGVFIEQRSLVFPVFVVMYPKENINSDDFLRRIVVASQKKLCKDKIISEDIYININDIEVIRELILTRPKKLDQKQSKPSFFPSKPAEQQVFPF